jgi:hypothetical protein
MFEQQGMNWAKITDPTWSTTGMTRSQDGGQLREPCDGTRPQHAHSGS